MVVLSCKQSIGISMYARWLDNPKLRLIEIEAGLSFVALWRRGSAKGVTAGDWIWNCSWKLKPLLSGAP